MTLPVQGALSLEDIKKELRIDLPNGVGPTPFDMDSQIALALARTSSGGSSKNFPLTLPDDFYGCRRPNDPIDFQSQISGGVFPRTFTATRATAGSIKAGLKVWRDNDVLRGQWINNGVGGTIFSIIPAIATSYAGVTDDHPITAQLTIVSGQWTTPPTLGNGTVVTTSATANTIELTYDGPYIGNRLGVVKLTVAQGDLPANTFQANISIKAENTFVPETVYRVGADINRAMWANVVSESDAYTHSIYSFILTNGGSGYGYYLWRNANGTNGFDEYYYLGPYDAADRMQFYINVTSFTESGGLGTGVPVGSMAYRNGYVNNTWQDIDGTERGIHVISNRRLKQVNFTVAVRQKTTGRVFQTVNCYIAAEVTISSWSMPVVNYPQTIVSSTTNNINVEAGTKIYRDYSSGQILLVPRIKIGTVASFENWTGGSGYLNGNVPLTTRVVPVDRIQMNWDTGGSGAWSPESAQTGSVLLGVQDYNSGSYFGGIQRSSNGTYNESVWISFTDTWTGATIWGGRQFIFSQRRAYNPPPPATPYDQNAVNSLPTVLSASSGAHGTGNSYCGAGFGVGWNSYSNGLTFIYAAAANYKFIQTANNQIVGGVFGQPTGYPNGKILTNSDNFDVRIYCTSGKTVTEKRSDGVLQGFGYLWRGAQYTMTPSGGTTANGNVADTGWISVSSLRYTYPGQKHFICVDALADGPYRQRGSYDGNWVFQMRDKSTGKIVVNHTIRIALSASGGTQNDR